MPALASVRTLCATAGDAVSLDPDPCQDIPADPTPPPPPESVPCNEETFGDWEFREEIAWRIADRMQRTVKAWADGSVGCETEVKKITATLTIHPESELGGASERSEYCTDCNKRSVNTRDNMFDDAWQYGRYNDWVCFNATLGGSYAGGTPAYDAIGNQGCHKVTFA